jgi:hypothetical protein
MQKLEEENNSGYSFFDRAKQNCFSQEVYASYSLEEKKTQCDQ